jgi:glycosyltransferase involved in cell wall biosynthesis
MQVKRYVNKKYKSSLTALYERAKSFASRGQKQVKEQKILMFGWELPPFNSGGLGVACYELAESLSRRGSRITFVLPKKQNVKLPFADLVFASDKIEITGIDSPLKPYQTLKSYNDEVVLEENSMYDPNLFGEVLRYGKQAAKVAKKKNFDVIHAHDWLSFPAGIEAKKISHKPLVVHVHATEFDRSGNGPIDQRIYNIERVGLENADRIITVSQFTKNKIAKGYGIDPNKIDVVYNGINATKIVQTQNCFKNIKKSGKKIVLFLGRITIQKGPDYFLKAAKKVIHFKPNTIFIMAGSGDMEKQMIQETAYLGISDKVVFTGFLSPDKLNSIYSSADVYIMPSVSEPFGIVALEALANKTPTIISKQSGVSETVENVLKVDFWDIDEIANKVLSVLDHKSLGQCLSDMGAAEVSNNNWDEAATKCLQTYRKVR